MSRKSLGIFILKDSGVQEQNQLRILDCGLQIEISNVSRIQNQKSAICIPKSYLLQHSCFFTPQELKILFLFPIYD
jgi:hypothetical protein